MALRKEIEVLSQNHEREVDRKDAIIQMLDRDLDEAEEQYQMALRAHLKEQDFLLEIQRSRVTALESTFDAELAALEQEFNTERQLILHKHQAEKRELQELMEAMAKDFDEQEHNTRHDFEGHCEEIKSKSNEELGVLKMQLMQIIQVHPCHLTQMHAHPGRGPKRARRCRPTLLLLYGAAVPSPQ